MEHVNCYHAIISCCEETILIDCFHVMFGMLVIDTYAVCGDTAAYLMTEAVR